MSIWMIWFVGYWVVESLLQAYKHGKPKTSTHNNFWEYAVHVVITMFPLYMMGVFG